MSYNYGGQSGYGNQGGYGQQSGYGNQSAQPSQGQYGYNSAYNPYEQTQNPYGSSTSQPGVQPYSDVEHNAGYEMAPVNNGAAKQSGINDILGECDAIKRGISDLKAICNTELATARQELLQSSTEKQDKAARQRLDHVEDNINQIFRTLRDSVKDLKNTPGSGDSRVKGPVRSVSENVKNEIEQYRKSQNEFQNRLKDQIKRRYAIANPTATDEELSQGVESVLLGQEQTFQVAGNRTRLANDARQATIERSTAIRKIEQDMIELGRLYEEVADLINRQDVAVEQINQGAETVVDNVDKANTQIDSAIHHARNRRKWKWYLLAIIILIIVIVVGVAVGVVEANKKN